MYTKIIFLFFSYFFLSFFSPTITQHRSPSEHSGRKGCCGQFLQSPKSLGLIAMIALGGIACALGGAAWGASGLAGQPSTHLTVSLLMIGKPQCKEILIKFHHHKLNKLTKQATTYKHYYKKTKKKKWKK